MLLPLLRRLPEVIAFAVVLTLQCVTAWVWVRRSRPAAWKSRAAVAFLLLSAVVLFSGFAANTTRGMMTFPREVVLVVRAAGLMWALLSLAILASLVVVRIVPRPRP